MAETGTSVGEITGQRRPINSCDFRPTRPFRIVTGSEDNTIGVFGGPPFKFMMTKQEHTRFVQAVRYSPDGTLFASAGFDGKVNLYDGATADFVCELGSPAAHKGGVYAVSWKSDSQQLLTCSADKTCKIWDISTKECIVEFTMGDTIMDQQVSCLWQNDYLLSVSLSGHINYLDINNPSKPSRIVKGHNKPITVLTLSRDHSTIYTGSHDGVVTKWNSGNGHNDRIEGIGHGNQINDIRAVDNFVYTCGIDDSLKQFSIEGNTYTNVDVKLSCQPRAMDILLEENIIVIGCVSEIAVAQDDRIVSVLKIDYESSCVSINPDTRDVAIGGNNSKIHIYQLNGTQLELKSEINHLGPLTDCAYSPDNKYLVACDANRKVILYNATDYTVSNA